MKLLLPIAAVFVVVLSIACGDDDDSAPPASNSAAVSPSPASPTSETTATAGQSTPLPSPAGSPPAPADGAVGDQPASTSRVSLKSTLPGDEGILHFVRLGVHPEQGGWDRVVFEFFDEGLPASTIEYVQNAAACGSGRTESLAGSAVLQVRMSPAAAHDPSNRATIGATSIKGVGDTILQAKQICDFEGVVTWAIGVKGKQNFKVSTLPDPPRLVIDVKH